ncbi:Ryanodine receptor 2 [Galemys pyrenaicus]|uniref:Ryanodine receptor 2 n=1 Tax=Galemys pyrenaicus TaxID=202257 RepID=A0A8J6AC45_GALPY|nr:Ryanodine receptor 2 [Galemys pyrenaicus]
MNMDTVAGGVWHRARQRADPKRFFLMYLINKDETEHTGQESYVWKMYQERCWEFFPAGDCFRKQYEDQLN